MIKLINLMELYVNNDTLVEDDISKIFKSSVICPLCKSILIKPFMCMKCQNVYCKKCIDNLSEKNEKCPNNCDSPTFQNCLVKNEILSKFYFSCVGCGKEIPYNEAEKHHLSCCPDKTSSNLKKREKPQKKSDIKRLKLEEVQKLKKQGKEINYITSNKIIYF